MISEVIRGAAIIAALFACIVWVNCAWWAHVFDSHETVNGCFCETFEEYGSWVGL